MKSKTQDGAPEALAVQNNGTIEKQRGEFSALAGAGRPWEQLPSEVKAVARADALDVLGEARGAGADALLIEAGYSAYAATRLLRDVGRA